MTQLIRGWNKLNTAYTYFGWNQQGGRLQNLTSTQVSTSDPLQNSTYDYDSVGNINTITDSLLGPQTQTFTYDELDRLTSWFYSYERNYVTLQANHGYCKTYSSCPPLP
jgi:hypothetical protein